MENQNKSGIYFQNMFQLQKLNMNFKKNETEQKINRGYVVQKKGSKIKKQNI